MDITKLVKVDVDVLWRVEESVSQTTLQDQFIVGVLLEIK